MSLGCLANFLALKVIYYETLSWQKKILSFLKYSFMMVKVKPTKKKLKCCNSYDLKTPTEICCHKILHLCSFEFAVFDLPT